MIRIRNLILILLFDCCAHLVCAQQSKSLVLPETGYVELYKNGAIQVYNERLVIAFGNMPSQISGIHKTYFVTLDSNLNVVDYVNQLSLLGNVQQEQSLVYNNHTIYLVQGNKMSSPAQFYHFVKRNILTQSVIFDSVYYNPPSTIAPRIAIYNKELNQIACIGITNPNINTHYSHFRVFDTLGNIIKHVDYPQFNYISQTGVGKLFWNNHLNLYNGIGVKKVDNRMKLMFQQIDTSGNLGIQKVLFPSIDIEGFYNVYDIIELPDGRIRFIVAAKPTGTTQFRRTYIATISAAGDSLDLLDTKNNSRWPLINDSTQIGARMVYTKDNHFLYSILTDRGQTSGSYVVKMDTNYNIKWIHETFAPIGLSHLFAASDGGYYGIAQIPSTHPDKNNEILVFKSDSTGKYNAVRTIGAEIENEIILTPNPATTQVHIESPIKTERYTLTNTSGTTIQSGELDASHSIDISQLPPGLYFLQLQLENGQTVTKKLVRSAE